MRGFLKFAATIVLILIVSQNLKGEDIDFRIYSRAGIKFNIVQGLSNTTDLELRTKEHSSKISVLRINTYFGYKFNSYFTIGAGYAFITAPTFHDPIVINGTTYNNAISNRYWIDATGSVGMGDFKLSLRERFQQTFALGTHVTLLRSELKLQYAIKKSIFTPFVSCEPHIYMFNSSKGAKEVRFNLGTTISINKSNDLQVFGRYTYNPAAVELMGVKIKTPDYFILGVNYYFKF